MAIDDYEDGQNQQAYPKPKEHSIEHVLEHHGKKSRKKKDRENSAFFDRIKEIYQNSFFAKESKDGKKWKVWVKPAVLLVFGVFLMCLSSVLAGGTAHSGEASLGREGKELQTKTSGENLPDYMEIEQQLEAKLERTIGQVAGVDHVLVSVTLDSSLAKDYARDSSTVSKTQQEDDASGVKRTIAEQTDNQQLVLEKGGATPIVIKESMPKVRGVAVVATGVENAATREEVFNIVQGLLDVPAHRIVITNGKASGKALGKE